MKLKNKLSTTIIALILILALTITANAATVPTLTITKCYSGYATIASIKDANDSGKNFCSMQGFAVGSTYLYSIKNTTGNTDYTKDSAQIYMTNKNTGKTSLLKYKSSATATAKNYISCLGHANGMDVTTIDGESALFIATMSTDLSNDLVQLKIDKKNCTATKVKGYKFYLKNDDGTKTRAAMSGVTVFKKTASEVQLLLKKGSKIYKGIIDLNSTSSAVNVTHIATLNKPDIKVDGKTYNVSAWDNQGFDYCKADGNLYVCYSDCAANSAILVFGGIDYTATKAKKLDAYTNKAIVLKDSKYSALFEIEGCGYCSDDGMIYFNTNRRKTAKDTNYDGVHYVKSFTVK